MTPIRDSRVVFGCCARYLARLRLSLGSRLALAAAASLAAPLAITFARADEPPAQQGDDETGIRFHASAAAEVNFTDNVRHTADNQIDDTVFVPQLGLSVTGKNDRIKAFVSGTLRYDAFVDQTGLDRLTGDLLANTTVAVVPDLFFVDGSTQISDEFINFTDQSATGLPNGSPQTRLFNMQVSPYLTTQIGGEADFTLRGRLAHLSFIGLDDTPIMAEPSDATIYQSTMLISNGERSRRVQWRISADYTFEDRQDGQDFESIDGLLGLTVAVTPKLSAIGRIGYENVTDETIEDIHDLIWSGGLLFRPGENSTISVERRHRFGQDAWYGDVNVALSSIFALTANYEEHFEDQQLRLARALGDVFSQTGSLPSVPSPVNLNEDLVDLAFYAKDARLGAIFRDEDQEFDLWGTYTRREFTTVNDEDESAGLAGRYAQKLPNDFRVDLSGSLSSLLEPRIGQVKTEVYTLSGGVTYAISPDAGAHFEYTWSQTDGTDTVTENLLSASISKNF